MCICREQSVKNSRKTIIGEKKLKRLIGTSEFAEKKISPSMRS